MSRGPTGAGYYPTGRMPVMACNVVAPSQPLAAQAGLQTMMRGGNAVDAAIAAAVTLTVVEPTSNGIGGDAFAIIWDGNRLQGINGSGRAPQAWSPARFAGREQMPTSGWDSVTVPGAVDLWVQLSRRYGKLPFAELFTAARHYAAEGFLVSPKTAASWKTVEKLFRRQRHFRETFLTDGQAPAVGTRFRCPDQGQTLGQIAASDGEAFYRGELAARIVAAARAEGGALTADDLAAHRSQWLEPLAIEYHSDLSLHELPPNGQGLVALLALGILRQHSIRQYPLDSAVSLHLQLETMKLAFAVAGPQIGDPEQMHLHSKTLLAPDRLAELAGRIDRRRAQWPKLQLPAGGGTVYLTSADERGMMVSLIQSNYCGFGSGIVIPQTGISLHNRGSGFSLLAGHPNRVAGGKRPFHTIMPGFVTAQGRPLLSFGVMGGHMQPQGHLQLMVRIFDHGQDPQTACDAPRWFLFEDGSVGVEQGFSAAVLDELASLGHRIRTDLPAALFGGAQLIMKTSDGYLAASDHRKDGQAVGY